MSNLNFRVIPVLFCDVFGLEASFFHNEKKNFGCGENDKDEENLTELLSCTLQVDVHQIQPANKKMSSNAPRFDAGYLQRFARIFWATYVMLKHAF